MFCRLCTVFCRLCTEWPADFVQDVLQALYRMFCRLCTECSADFVQCSADFVQGGLQTFYRMFCRLCTGRSADSLQSILQTLYSMFCRLCARCSADSVHSVLQTLYRVFCRLCTVFFRLCTGCSGLLGCDAASKCTWDPTFRKNPVPSLSNGQVIQEEWQPTHPKTDLYTPKSLYIQHGRCWHTRSHILLTLYPLHNDIICQ